MNILKDSSQPRRERSTEFDSSCSAGDLNTSLPNSDATPAKRHKPTSCTDGLCHQIIEKLDKNFNAAAKVKKKTNDEHFAGMIVSLMEDLSDNQKDQLQKEIFSRVIDARISHRKK